MSVLVLDELPPAVAEGLHGVGAARPFRAGEVLFEQGTEAHAAYVVLSGLVKVDKISPDGTNALLALCGVGEILGELSALDGLLRSASATTLLPSELLQVPRDALIDLVMTHPDFALALLQGMCTQVRDASSHILELASSDAAALLGHRLLQLATESRFEQLRSRRGSVIVIESPLSHHDLAEWAGVSDRSAGAAFREFRVDGLVATGRLRIEILDLPGLTERAANRRQR